MEPHTTTQKPARSQAARSPTDRQATTLAWQRPPLSSCSLAPGPPPAAPFLPGLRKLGLWAPGPSGVRDLSFPIHSPHTPSTRAHTLNLGPGPFQDPEARAPSSATRSRSQAHLSPPYPQGAGALTRRRSHRRVYLGLWGDSRGEGTTNVCRAGADKTFGTRGLRPSSIATPERSRPPTGRNHP